MRKLILSAALLAVPLASSAAVDLYHDARYERLCVKHFSDAPICDSGYAADAHRRCAMLDYPPGFIPPTRHTGAKCVQARLAYEKKQKKLVESDGDQER
jgi:hypothetical protein